MNFLTKSRPYKVNAAKDEILALARTHNVAYRPMPLDALADDITRLSGDDVKLDEPELLLTALRRAGHLTKAEAASLHGAYLRSFE